MSPETVLMGLAAAIAAFPLAYLLGLTFSRGYHRGKREYVSQLLSDSMVFDGKD